ncbi:MAG: stage V sporulation protein AC [Oscillospiraceae bacterium]|nr:stage V sporulation protein AC [Oscillospiraceae bacterium]
MKKLTDMSDKEYAAYVKQISPKSPLGKDCIWAFVVGGLICVLGQALKNLYLFWGLGDKPASTAVSVSLIFLSALATGLNVYDDLARYAGAGTLVPITGFANSVVSPAMEFRAEGVVTGMAAKMFVIAGPVLVFGIFASALYGLIYWIWTVWFL